jgi:ubiquinone/menaquinone biosynthesis C-methylase UbiE
MTSLDRVERQWTALGEQDPLWAILSVPEMKGGKWDEAAFFETGRTEVASVLETACRLVHVQPGTAVDFGCGVGRLTQALGAHFEHAVGIDIAEPMIRGARKMNRFPDRCEYIHNPAPDLAILADGCADFVYSSITLQHVTPNLASAYIREFFRVLRPGGMAVFQLPSSPRSLVWQRAKAFLPLNFTNWLWRVRTGSAEAMESYFTPPDRVKKIVQDANGEILLAEPDQSGPPGWDSRKYFCGKPGLAQWT